MDDWQVRVNHAGEKLLRKGEDLEGMTDRQVVTMWEAYLAAEAADRAAVWKLAGISAGCVRPEDPLGILCEA